mgnify:CR=1 FL=1
MYVSFLCLSHNIHFAVSSSAVGMVTQDTFLFNDTIKENLLYARPGATHVSIYP